MFIPTFVLRKFSEVPAPPSFQNPAYATVYCRPDIYVWVNGKQSKPFRVGVGLSQGCLLSPLLFIVAMNSIDECSQADECATIGNCKISRLLRLLFAEDLVLLSSTESDLQRALNSMQHRRNENKRCQNWGASFFMKP